MNPRILLLFAILIASILPLAAARPAAAIQFRALLADPAARDTDPAPSPDGKWIAFQSNRGG
ncbi:MAG TPA: hypothetical protein VFV24_07985, partial [Candidatus Eisenbacteria bacterium]|nr:hypothetical protein [Candidatus Eisenbacteria bacterium]